MIAVEKDCQNVGQTSVTATEAWSWEDLFQGRTASHAESEKYKFWGPPDQHHNHIVF